MRRIIAHVLQLHLGPFLLGFSVVTFLLTTDFLLDYLDLLINKGVSAVVVGQLFLYALGWMVALSIPCGVLVAALMAFGRLAQDNEITALRAGGVSPARVLVGPVLAAGALAAGLAWFNDRILPETNHRYANLVMDIGQKRPALDVREGVLLTDVEGYAFLVGRVDPRTDTLYDAVVLRTARGPGAEGQATIVAKRAVLHYERGGTLLSVRLWDGELHETLRDDPRVYRRLRFATQTVNVPGMSTELVRSQRTSRGDREMTSAEMRAEIRRIGDERALALERIEAPARALGFRSAREALAALYPSPTDRLLQRLPLPWLRHRPPAAAGTPASRQTFSVVYSQVASEERRIDSLRVEIHKKFAIPAACVVFVLLGAPLGMRARRGGVGIGFLSVGFFVLYYLFLIGGENLADRQLLSPVVAMWAANVLLGTVGLVLCAKACDVGWRPARVKSPGGRPRPIPADIAEELAT